MDRGYIPVRFGDTDTSCSEDEGWRGLSQSSTPPQRRTRMISSSTRSSASPSASQGSYDRRVSLLREDKHHIENEVEKESSLMLEQKLVHSCDQLVIRPAGTSPSSSSTLMLNTPEVDRIRLNSYKRKVSQGHRSLSSGDGRPSSPLSRPDKRKEYFAFGDAHSEKKSKRLKPYDLKLVHRDSNLSNGGESPTPSSPSGSNLSLPGSPRRISVSPYRAASLTSLSTTTDVAGKITPTQIGTLNSSLRGVSSSLVSRSRLDSNGSSTSTSACSEQFGGGPDNGNSRLYLSQSNPTDQMNATALKKVNQILHYPHGGFDSDSDAR